MTKSKNSTNQGSADNKTTKENLRDKAGSPKQEKAPEDVRQGRKSLTIPKGYGAKNKVRYVEGTTKLKDGCWLSDK